jgi:type I restriction enzyme S subunit
MNWDLPQGWTSATISDVTERVPNAKPESTPNEEFGYIDISSIDNSTFRITDVKRFKGKDAPSRARRPIRTNDVLFSNVRTNLRNIALVAPEAKAQLCSTGFTVLRPNAGIDPHFLFRYVLTNDFIGRVTPQQTGTHYPATSDRVVIAEEIALPPFAEQRRIVAKIEKLLGQVDACQGRMAKIPTRLKRFRQSVLAAACSGRLTADWRDKNVASEDWKLVTLGAVVEFIGGSQPPKKHFIHEPRRGYVRFIQIRDYKSDKNLTFIPRDLARRFCTKTDVMIGRYGPPLFQILRGIEGAYNVALMKAIPRDSKLVSNDFQFSERTVGQDGVRKDLLEAYETRLPPLQEQEEIVRRVNKLFTLADRIEARFSKAQQSVSSLTQAILAKAFRGELVPTEYELAKAEGRSFESAEELLERIKATGGSITDEKRRPERGKKQPASVS